MTVDVTPTQDWRGVAAEGQQELSDQATVSLRSRSRRLLGSLVRPHRRSLYLVLVIILLQNAVSMAGPYLVTIGIDRGIPAMRSGNSTPLIVVVVAITACALIGGGLRWLFLRCSGKIGQAFLLELRQRVFTKFQKLPLQFHEKYTSGKVIARLTSDIDAISDLIDDGLDGLVNALLSLVSIAIILFFLDVPLALVALMAFPPLWFLMRWFQRHSAVAYRKTRETIALLIVHFVESLAGIRAVQAFRREKRNGEIFGQLNKDFFTANSRGYLLAGMFVPGVTFISALTTTAILMYGGMRVLDGDLKIGVLAGFLLYLRRFYEPLEDISMFYNTYQSAVAALEKLSGVLEEPSSVPEPSSPAHVSQSSGQVEFRSVRFSYGDAVVLPDLSLTIQSGQTVALVGTTGAGKSTLARLLSRFYDPIDGTILLDQRDLRTLTDSELRRFIVMVTQENFLFSGTVADNIALGNPDATVDQIHEAAKAIGAHNFIVKLPDGYDTNVGKQGGRLSAGQRQLIAFARAFLANPTVLILDEATSSLDVPSERLVQRALRTLLPGRTAVIIAHRLSTVEIADRVLVMEHGRIIEDGTPAELINSQGQFAELHQSWKDSLV